MTANEWIQALRDEELGFKFDRPWRLGDSSLLAIIPILRDSKQRRNYITFAEAGDIECKDTGDIDSVYIRNNEEQPVYVSRGDIFRGKTQERAAIHGHIIMPHKGLRVAVRCIHLSKGIRSGESNYYGGRTPYQIDLSDQHRTWHSVAVHNTGYNAACEIAMMTGGMNRGTSAPDIDSTYPDTDSTSLFYSAPYSPPLWNSPPPLVPKDDLVGALDSVRDAVKEALRKLPAIKNQVGAVFFNDVRLIGMDVYDLPLSWKAIKEEMISKEGVATIEEDENLFEMRPERATKVIRKKLEEPFEETVIYDRNYQVIGLKNSQTFGEATIYKDRVIHLTLWRRPS